MSVENENLKKVLRETVEKIEEIECEKNYSISGEPDKLLCDFSNIKKKIALVYSKFLWE